MTQPFSTEILFVLLEDCGLVCVSGGERGAMGEESRFLRAIFDSLPARFLS
jgi:hypothetical protein